MVHEVEFYPDDINFNKSRVLSIDLGLDNFITTSNNCGLVPFIISITVLIMILELLSLVKTNNGRLALKLVERMTKTFAQSLMRVLSKS